VPVHEATPSFDLCLQSLANNLPAASSVHILDYGPPDSGVQSACDSFQGGNVQLKYARGEMALANLWQPGNDLLLLSSQSKVTSGFLEEMQSVLHLHERHAVIAPRTDGSTVLSFESYQLWEQLHNALPRYHLVPTVPNSCLFIRGEVVEQFGLFDIAPGLDAVNGFVRRINRYGYSTLAANWAYVFGGQLDAGHLTTLVSQYPELDRKLSGYSRFQIDPVEVFSILHSPHRPRILYDLYHLPPQHSGTSDFALNLLREIEPLVREEFDLYVGAGEEQAFFLTDLCGYHLYAEKNSMPMVFDLVYKPSQIFRWPEFSRMTRLASRVVFTLQDIIALRCDYIGNASLPPIFQRTAELADLVIAISESSRSDFAAYYSAEFPMRVIHHGSHGRLITGEKNHGEHIFIIGNALAHKGVAEAVDCLGDDFPLVVVGGQNPDRANVRWLPSGQLSRRLMFELLMNARVVVYPSYYEGYGLPVADALALAKPVIVLDTAVNREIAASTHDPNLHLLSSLKQLHSAARSLWDEPSPPPQSPPRLWRDAAAEYLIAFRELLNKDIDLAKMRQRWETVRLIESLNSS
jgi:glycosyltransferase involved in cell wall biosynthesis